jgi:hypothetical protein
MCSGDLRFEIEVVGMDGRNSLGQFVVGNKGGPGNPAAAAVARNRAALLEAVEPDKLKAIVLSLVQQALDGDVAAARLVLERLCGKPEASTTTPTVAIQNVLSAGQSESAGRGLAMKIAQRIQSERAAVIEHRPGEPS